MKITKATVAKLKAPDPSGGQRLFWDDDLKGFGVLVSGVTDAKSFVVQRGVGGRKRRITLGTLAEFEASKTSVEEIRAKAARTLVDMRDGKDPRARWRGELTLKEWFKEYKAARPNLSERTLEAYDAGIARFDRYLEGPLRDLTPERLERAYRAIKARVARSGPKGAKRPSLYVSEAGSAAANASLRALRSVWIFAQGRDPDRVPPWPAGRMRGQWFSVGRRERHVKAENLAKFHAAANAVDEKGEYVIGRLMRDYVLFLLLTGMRRGEAASLRWADVDFAAGVIRVSAFRTKSRRPLALPMSGPLRDLLAARREQQEEVGSEFVFPGPGESGHLAEPKKTFAALSTTCGFPVNPHALRATFITITDNTPGVTPLAARALVNHAVDVGDVHAGYVQDVELRGAAEAVGQRLAALCGIAAPKKAKREPAKSKGKRAPRRERRAA